MGRNLTFYGRQDKHYEFCFPVHYWHKMWQTKIKILKEKRLSNHTFTVLRHCVFIVVTWARVNTPFLVKEMICYTSDAVCVSCTSACVASGMTPLANIIAFVSKIFYRASNKASLRLEFKYFGLT